MIVLEPSAFPVGFVAAAPGLNARPRPSTTSWQPIQGWFDWKACLSKDFQRCGSICGVERRARRPRAFQAAFACRAGGACSRPMSSGKDSCLARGETILTPFQHAARICLLMAATAVLLTWALRHNEASFADGLRYIRQAEQIDRGAWRDGLFNSIDHPLHPLGIVMARGLVGGDGPVAWQRAAVGLAFGCVVLLVIPLYLLAREIFGDGSAWLGCVLVMTNPLLGGIVANVLSESSFLLFWTWGLWAAVRFLREGRFVWLPLALAFGVLAFFSRPEGLLLPMAIVTALALLPLSSSTRINWPRWWGAVGFLMLGLVVLAGPYMAVKGAWQQSREWRGCWAWQPSRRPTRLSASGRYPPIRRPLKPTAWQRSECSESFAEWCGPPCFLCRRSDF